jgi:hypothetical protein
MYVSNKQTAIKIKPIAIMIYPLTARSSLSTNVLRRGGANAEVVDMA